MTAPFAEPASLHQDRLHNCGPTSGEVFRTPAIGRVVTFYAGSALAGWKGEPSVRDVAHDPVRAAALVLPAVLEELGIPTPSGRGRKEERTLRMLGALVEALRERGHTHGLVGIASHAWGIPYGDPPAQKHVSTLVLARTLGVYAVYAPPLVLWSRTPSLQWLRGSHVTITLRRFDTGLIGGGAS
jgi:hypothetical protein